MTSERQYSANRLNSLRSTGPRSDEGKERSRKNALKHGLSATTIVLIDENAEEFESFREALLQEFEPEGGLGAYGETLLDQLAATLWRLRRIPKIEAALFGHIAYEEEQKRDRKSGDIVAQNLDNMTGAYGGLTPDAPKVVKIGQVWDLIVNHSDTLGKIARYEASLLRKCEDLIGELRAIKSARARPQKLTAE